MKWRVARISPKKEFLVTNTVIISLLIAWVLLTGGTVSWDAMNHHLYLGREMLYGSRLRIDEYAIGVMSCQYPLGYLPLVAMLDAGWSGNSIFTALALLSSISIPACWIISWVIIPSSELKFVLIRTLSTVVASVGVVWWQMLIQTSNDGFSTALVTLAFALMFFAFNPGVTIRQLALLSVIAGVLSAIAISIKITHLIAVVGVLMVFIFIPFPIRIRFSAMALYSLVLACALTLISYYWAMEIFDACGSPIHPFFLEFFE